MHELLFLDFHVHALQPPSPGVLRVVSVGPFDVAPDGEPCTVGLHPWSTAEEWADAAISALPKVVEQRGAIGLGEVGLDRLRGASMSRQRALLAQQLRLADGLGLPVVLHCVRAWAELLAELRQFPALRWAVHGFRGSSAVAYQLLEAGGRISLGAALLRDVGLEELAATLPVERMFLETDDVVGLPVQELYLRVAELRGLGIDELRRSMMRNGNNFFGDSLICRINN